VIHPLARCPSVRLVVRMRRSSENCLLTCEQSVASLFSRLDRLLLVNLTSDGNTNTCHIHSLAHLDQQNSANHTPDHPHPTTPLPRPHLSLVPRYLSPPLIHLLGNLEAPSATCRPPQARPRSPPTPAHNRYAHRPPHPRSILLCQPAQRRPTGEGRVQGAGGYSSIEEGESGGILLECLCGMSRGRWVPCGQYG
jgi:hypothetical protein